MSSAITGYLDTVLLCLTDKSIGELHHFCLRFWCNDGPVGLKNTTEGNSGFLKTKEAINVDIEKCAESTGYLTIKIGAMLGNGNAEKRQTERRQVVLDWLWKRCPDVKDLAFRILLWVFNAKRPLQMNELRELVCIEIGDKDIKHHLKEECLVDVCESLVVYDNSTGTVRFTH